MRRTISCMVAIGILLVAVGAGLVLFSKEETESSKSTASKPAQLAAAPTSPEARP